MRDKQVRSCIIRTVLCSHERQFNIHNTHKVRNSVSHDAEYTNIQSSTMAGEISYRENSRKRPSIAERPFFLPYRAESENSAS